MREKLTRNGEGSDSSEEQRTKVAYQGLFEAEVTRCEANDVSLANLQERDAELVTFL